MIFFLLTFPWVLIKCEKSVTQFYSFKLMEHWPDFLELDNLKIESKSIMIGSQSTGKLLKKKN